jgi:hypothetical protein
MMLEQRLLASHNILTRSFFKQSFGSACTARTNPQARLANSIIRRYVSYDNRATSLHSTEPTQTSVTASPKKPRKKTPSAVLLSRKYWGYPLYNFTKKEKLERWKALGPPPLSEYRLTFGKHKGQLLDDVPLTYMVKYLIPRCRDRTLDCPIVGEAVGDYMKRHPEMKSQAGMQKTKPIEGTK